MKDFFSGIAGIAVGLFFAVVPTLAEIYAVAHDLQFSNYFWAAIDIILFPIGVIRGVLLFFGWV